MATLTMKVPLEMAEKVAAFSARARVPKSKIMRDALDAVLRQQKDAPSMYELMKDGIGCFDSGVSDKSTNSKHMKGYGKWRV